MDSQAAQDDRGRLERAKLYQGFGTGFSGALELVIITSLGYFLGALIDGRLGTRPWFAIGGLMLGATGGFIRLYYHSKMQEENEGVPKRRRPPG